MPKPPPPSLGARKGGLVGASRFLLGLLAFLLPVLYGWPTVQKGYPFWYDEVYTALTRARKQVAVLSTLDLLDRPLPQDRPRRTFLVLWRS